MKRIFKVTKIRFLMLTFSAILILGGLAGVFFQGGFNYGIDYIAGLSLRVQIAPTAMNVVWSGNGEATLNIINDTVEVEVRSGEGVKGYSYPLSEFDTLGEVAAALSNIEGIDVTMLGTASDSSASILGFSHERELGDTPVTLNSKASVVEAETSSVRELLSGLDDPQIQNVGLDIDQEFIIRVKDPGTDKQFNQNKSDEILSLLRDEFGEDQVMLKQADYVGPRFSQSLGAQSILIVIFSFILIMVYIWFRFKLGYALSAIAALVHDVLIMIGVIGTFQLEISTATIAAVLTIIGYSLNDTIVVFDRIRENRNIMRDDDLHTVINTSITQSLSRTLITSVTTLLAVVSIYIFGTGLIKDFALNLIIGIVVGTYSSIFIASPILLGWFSSQAKRLRKNDAKQFGDKYHDPNNKTNVVGFEPAAKTAPVKKAEIPQIERKLKGKRKGKK